MLLYWIWSVYAMEIPECDWWEIRGLLSGCRLDWPTRWRIDPWWIWPWGSLEEDLKRLWVEKWIVVSLAISAGLWTELGRVWHWSHWHTRHPWCFWIEDGCCDTVALESSGNATVLNLAGICYGNTGIDWNTEVFFGGWSGFWFKSGRSERLDLWVEPA
jgi:hypothetical protein